MTSDRNAASRNSAGAVRPEEESAVKDKTPADSTAPRAGRTGNLGSKAERPADSRAHKSNSDGAEPTRESKIPSPAARDGEAGGDDSPQAVRDSIA